MRKHNLTKIIVLGEAGHGVRFLARKLCKLVNQNDKKLSITYFFDYDSTVRGGQTQGYITIGRDGKLNGFVFNDCNILVSFIADIPKKFKYKEAVGHKENGKKVDFQDISLEKFDNSIHANMIALGYLAKKLKIKKILAKDILKDKNLKAFNLGYSIK